MEKTSIIKEIIIRARELNASDIHLQVDAPPCYRVDGKLQRDIKLLDNAMMDQITFDLTGNLFRVGDVEIDAAVSIDETRCRINLFKSQGHEAVAIRILNDCIPSIDDLGLPIVVAEFAAYNQGLVLVTGETGSGKSTTLASIIDTINHSDCKHILTLEDPIEYIYKPDKCWISQREIRKDTKSFATGLRAALREDPDVILVGEMRDLDTIETALTAAETGHLVFGTVHTNSAADSIDRLVDVFPAERQPQIRLQLSMSLKAVLSQQLLPKVGGGRVLGYEVMKVDGAIKNLIREGKTPQIMNAIQTSGSSGNILMDRCLQGLYSKGLIDESTYKKALRDPSNYSKR